MTAGPSTISVPRLAESAFDVRTPLPPAPPPGPNRRMPAALPIVTKNVGKNFKNNQVHVKGTFDFKKFASSSVEGRETTIRAARAGAPSVRFGARGP